MEEFNVVKRWTVDKHVYKAFITVERNMSLTSAEWQLENEREMQKCIIGNDCDEECDYDNSLYGKFSYTCHGIKFTCEIEQVQESKPNVKDFTKYKHKVCYN